MALEWGFSDQLATLAWHCSRPFPWGLPSILMTPGVQ